MVGTEVYWEWLMSGFDEQPFWRGNLDLDLGRRSMTLADDG